MTRLSAVRWGCWLCAAVLVWFAPDKVCAQSDPRPNLLLILVDDLRFNDVNALGHPYLHDPVTRDSLTPNIDHLASEGMIFTSSFCSTPLCSPGRAAILTSEYATTNGIQGNDGTNSVSDFLLRTYPVELQEAGYSTGYVGKWHMNGSSGAKPGFDYWASFKGQGKHTDVQMNVNGVVSTPGGYTTDLLTNYAIDYVQNHGSKPFALTLAYKAVHSPVDNTQIPPAYQNIPPDGSVVPRQPNAEAYDLAAAGQKMLANTTPTPQPGLTGTTTDAILGRARMTVQLDDNIGRLMNTLQTTGQLDNTLVLFTSDNGYFWGEHGLGDKRAAYEESIKVPMIARMPGLIPAGTTSNSMVMNIDIAPTFLDLAGAPIPSTMQGKSLVPVFKDPAKTVRSSMLIEYYQEATTVQIPTWHGVRTERYKYITYNGYDSSYDELYDLQADPYEMTNLITDPNKAGVLADLKQELAHLSAQTPEVNRAYRGDKADYAINNLSNRISSSVTGGSLRIGANSTGTGNHGRNAVLIFALPPVAANQEVTRSTVTVQVTNNRTTDTTLHGDLWAVGIGGSGLSVPYLQSDTDTDSTHVKLFDNLLTSATLTGGTSVSINPYVSDALTDYLRDFYEDHPNYAGGQYLYLRLNPDKDPGALDNGWDIGSADNGAGNSRPLLSLEITTVPEPGTIALLLAGAGLLLARAFRRRA